MANNCFININEFNVKEIGGIEKIKAILKHLMREMLEAEKNNNITFCGASLSWEDCLTIELINGIFICCLYYNVGKNTKLVRINIHNNL